ncbi:MAG: UDP-3-O-acyl-N-acetylglucosamine deacetylase [Gammaproteobacteria bacterium]
MIRQRTLKNLIRATGVGLHTGEKIRLTLRPAPVDTGIVFRRIDLAPPVEIPARVAHVGESDAATCLEKGGACIAAVEHMLSAFAGLGVDNAYVDLDAPEVPVMDGSAGPFVFLIQSAGISEQAAAKPFLKVRRSVQVSAGGQWARLEPYEGFKVSVAMDFEHPRFQGRLQEASIDFSAASFVREISRARNFRFVQAQEETPATLGGTVDNTVLVDKQGVLNEDGLRYQDEFVKHKVLDAVGDLYLLGQSLIGAYSACKSGHALNKRLLDALLAAPEAWEIMTFDDAAQAGDALRRAAG